MSDYAETAYYIARVLLWIAALLGIAFPFLYHHHTQGTWSFTPIGRHVMGTQTIFALMLLFTATAVYVPTEVTVTAAMILYLLAIVAFTTQIGFVCNPKMMDPQDVLDDPTSSTPEHRLLIREDPTMTVSTSPDLLAADARNRALRTFVQSLAIDVLLAVALVIYNIFSTANAWSDMDWAAIGFLLAKTVLVSIASFVMRRFVDQSSIPTPLPPAPQSAPADTTPNV